VIEPGDVVVTWESYVVLQAVQAHLALVTPNMLAIALDAEDREAVTLHYVLAEVTEDDLDAIDDAAGELDINLEGHIGIHVEIHTGAVSPEWPGFRHRRFFRSRASPEPEAAPG
jgi:hypothetical protein